MSSFGFSTFPPSSNRIADLWPMGSDFPFGFGVPKMLARDLTSSEFSRSVNGVSYKDNGQSKTPPGSAFRMGLGWDSLQFSGLQVLCLLLFGAMAGLPKGSAAFARYGFMTREPGFVVSSSATFMTQLLANTPNTMTSLVCLQLFQTKSSFHLCPGAFNLLTL